MTKGQECYAYPCRGSKNKLKYIYDHTTDGTDIYTREGQEYYISDGYANVLHGTSSVPTSILNSISDHNNSVNEQELNSNVYYYSNVEGKGYPSSKESYNSDMSNAVNEKCLAYPINEGLLGKEIDSQNFIDFSHFSNFTSVNSSYIK